MANEIQQKSNAMTAQRLKEASNAQAMHSL
jgi:hypothetical protein